MTPDANLESPLSGEVQSAPRILIVDDDDTVRESLNAVLKHDGFETVTASNVKDALHQISTQSFDVLLTDLHMPQAGDGLTVVSAMHPLQS
jgi:DNA-binding NtrC family response regulator